MTVIPVSCPFCDADLDKLENIIIIVQGWPLMGWECSCCKRNFSINHPAVQETIKRSLQQEFRRRRTDEIKTESFRALKSGGSIRLGAIS